VVAGPLRHPDMSPPNWGGRPTYPCPRCGREASRDRYPLSTLDHLKWQMFTVVTIVNWCGHGLDSLVMPDAEDGWAQLIPVLAEAW
jgi:hypothetical protein